MRSLAILAIVCMVLSCQSPKPQKRFHHALADQTAPWTHENFQDSDSSFTFAVISDLNGGERERIFEIAVAQVNLLNPALVMSVGDLIDGGTEDLDQLEMEWENFEYRAELLNAPFFHVGGNHDLTNSTMRAVWAKKYGPRYSHFLYKDVLFLMIDSEDFSDERMKEIYDARAEAIEVIDTRPEDYPSTEYYAMPERKTGAISGKQSAYFEKVIAENRQVRWTFLFMHKPTWERGDEKGLGRIVKALGSRKYTVFAGHEHSYRHQQIDGNDYMVLGTTGGAQHADDPMSFDHITLVSVSNEAPKIATIRMDGILTKEAEIPLNGDTLSFQASRSRD